MKSEVWVGDAVNYSHIGGTDEKTRDLKVRIWVGGKGEIKKHLFRAYSPVILGNMMLQFR